MYLPTPKPNHASERQLKAREMRNNGLPYHMIAKLLGYHDASGARKAAERAQKEIFREDVETHRFIEFNRLEMMYKHFLPKALAGDITYARLIISIIKKQAKIMGSYGIQKMMEKEREREREREKQFKGTIIYECDQKGKRLGERTH